MLHRRAPTRMFASAMTAILTIGAAAHPLSPQQSVSVTDSAGVRIVESRAPAWSAGGEWRLGTEPIFTIGAESGDPNYMFEGVSHALRLEDGTIAVVDRRASEIWLFDPAGVFLRSLGGSGEGPGEFQFLQEVWARGDTILASDNMQSRISVFDRDGDVLETIRVEAAPGMGSRTAQTQFADGTVLVLNAPSGGIRFGSGDVLPGAVWRLDRYSREGRFMHEISTLQESSRWEHGIEGLSPGLYLPFSLGIPAYAASEDYIYAGGGIEPSIARWNNDGALSRVIRWAIPERRVSDEDKRRFRQANSDAPRYDEPTAWARYLREIPFPERMPLYRRLLVDAGRNLWAERFRPPWGEGSSWYVFDEQGAWLGEVDTPPGLFIFEIGTDYVLGRYRDELDVQSVVVIPLDRVTTRRFRPIDRPPPSAHPVRRAGRAAPSRDPRRGRSNRRAW